MEKRKKEKIVTLNGERCRVIRKISEQGRREGKTERKESGKKICLFSDRRRRKGEKILISDGERSRIMRRIRKGK